MKSTSNVWPAFFFDGNRWNGFVASAEEFNRLLEYYGSNCLKAKIAPLEEIAKLPDVYFIGAKGVCLGGTPSFGFRREHIGKETLGAFLKRYGVELP